MSRQRTVMKRTAQTVHRKNNIYLPKKHTNGMLFLMSLKYLNMLFQIFIKEFCHFIKRNNIHLII